MKAVRTRVKRRGGKATTASEQANELNLRRAFEKVASNRGAPGPDRQSIDELREHFNDVRPALHRALLDGSYRPGSMRRVWIPKSGGGQRGRLLSRLEQKTRRSAACGSR